MKRQKRNQADRAFRRGYLAASQGKPQDMCPYINGEAHQEWVNGWREGREDYWNGFGTSARAQKLENFRSLEMTAHHPDGWRTA